MIGICPVYCFQEITWQTWKQDIYELTKAPGNPSDDYIHKLYFYKYYGAREYWIVDPRRKTVTVNYFEGNMLNIQYSFDSTIKVNIYDDLLINFLGTVNK